MSSGWIKASYISPPSHLNRHSAFSLSGVHAHSKCPSGFHRTLVQSSHSGLKSLREVEAPRADAHLDWDEDL